MYSLIEALEKLHDEKDMAVEGWPTEEFIRYDKDSQSIIDERANEVIAFTLFVNKDQIWVERK